MRPLLGLVLCAFTTTALAGEVVGKVSYSGLPPPAPRPATPRDTRACGASIPDESMLIGPDHALKNAVVYLEDAPARPAATGDKVVLDNAGCRYVPHVLAARVGDELELSNSDAVFHNVNASAPGGKMAFNVALPLKGQKRQVKLERPAVLHALCNAGHPWMSGWIHVFPHPFFAVTGEDGAFKLRDVPPGTYTLAAWHEKLGVKKTRVVVGERGRVEATFDFTEPVRPLTPQTADGRPSGSDPARP